MKWIRVLCLLGWISAGLQAADATRPAARRFLLVVEASSSSAKCVPAIENAARQLVGGSFGGMMQPGDTFGVWVYQVKVDVSFPMQVWKPTEAGAITQGVVDHVRSHKFDEPPIWENVMAPLQRVAAMSDDLTIAVLSSPGNRLNIDGELNAKIAAVYATSETDLLKSKLPFVTFFAVRGGKLVDAAVNSGIGPWTIPDPPVPVKPKPEPAPVANNAVKPAAPKPARPDLLPPESTTSNASQVFSAVAAVVPHEETSVPPVTVSTVRPTESDSPVPKGVEVAPATPPVAREAVKAAPPILPATVSPSEPKPVVATILPEPVQPVVVAPNGSSTSVVQQTTVAAVAVEPKPVEPGKTITTAAPVVTPVVATVEPSRTGYLVGGAALLVLAMGLAGWFFLKGRRAAAPVSLITRSLDRR